MKLKHLNKTLTVYDELMSKPIDFTNYDLVPFRRKKGEFKLVKRRTDVATGYGTLPNVPTGEDNVVIITPNSALGWIEGACQPNENIGFGEANYLHYNRCKAMRKIKRGVKNGI